MKENSSNLSIPEKEATQEQSTSKPFSWQRLVIAFFFIALILTALFIAPLAALPSHLLKLQAGSLFTAQGQKVAFINKAADLKLDHQTPMKAQIRGGGVLSGTGPLSFRIQEKAPAAEIVLKSGSFQCECSKTSREYWLEIDWLVLKVLPGTKLEITSEAEGWQGKVESGKLEVEALQSAPAGTTLPKELGPQTTFKLNPKSFELEKAAALNSKKET